MGIFLYSYEESPFSNESTGWPYIWVQQICGLEFLSPSIDEPGSSKTDLKMASVYMESVIKAIRTRLIARVQLTHQIISLGKLFKKIKLPFFFFNQEQV